MFNNYARYGAVAMILHWAMALMIIAIIGIGLYMVEPSNFDPKNVDDLSRQFDLYQLHKSLGLTVLGLSVVRLFWRLINVIPELPAHMSTFEKLAAHATHILFYGIMIGLPLTGWMMVSVSPLEIPTLYFNFIFLEVPHLPAMSFPVIGEFKTAKEAEAALKMAHQWLAYGTIALLMLHIGAAMYHHLLKGDDVLTRMLPFTGR